MRESLHAKVIFRAAQAMGGASALAEAVGVSVQEVQSWMRSEAPIPEPVYCALLDAITDDVLGKLRNQKQES